MSYGRTPLRIAAATLLGLPLVSCSGSPSGSPVLTAEMPLRLDEHHVVALQFEAEFRRLHHGAGRDLREVVSVQRHVDVAERHIDSFELLDLRVQRLGEWNAARANAN